MQAFLLHARAKIFPYHSTRYDARLPPSLSYLSLFFQLFSLSWFIGFVSPSRRRLHEGSSTQADQFKHGALIHDTGEELCDKDAPLSECSSGCRSKEMVSSGKGTRKEDLLFWKRVEFVAVKNFISEAWCCCVTAA
ncbi:hypothetical protein VNO80_03484 [Phaseolus coccineus]|uniref:Uncharacterized protein n=1 Tax=Phaseolus coccineus TaxID=3886 RepID=A0AAN9RRQ1_PHACN